MSLKYARSYWYAHAEYVKFVKISSIIIYLSIKMSVNARCE